MSQSPHNQRGLDARAMSEHLRENPELKNLALVYDRVIDLAQRVDQSGGRAYLVGGSVVSEFVHQVPGDFDLEIHGLSANQLENILDQVAGQTNIELAGKSYGVYRWRTSGIDIECSLPRRDSKTGAGHRDFRTTIEPNMGVAAAAKRRDFTIGAIYKDVLTGQIEDPFGGQQDLANHILRIVDEHTFGDDPLRVLRGVQLAGRYNLTAEPATREKMIALVPATKHLPAERFTPEWQKLFLKSARPSVGLELARDIGLFRIWSPELDALKHVPQDLKHHPEGDVWSHTMQVVDRIHDHKVVELPVILAALLHDIGKSDTTTTNDDGRIIAYGHDRAGLAAAEKFMTGQGFSNDTIAATLALISEHMAAHQLYAAREHIHPGAFRRLARRLAPATIDQLSILTAADSAGRETADNSHLTPDPAATWLLSHAVKLGVEKKPPATIIKGRDLIARGWAAGPMIGKIIQAGEAAIENGRGAEEIVAVVKTSADPAAALAGLLKLASTAE